MSGGRLQRIGQHCDERIELDVGRRAGFVVRPVQRPGGKSRLAADELGDAASVVCAAMMRHAVTGSACPMRWLRSMAWVCPASI
jgi:hypothetical protein